MLALEVSTNKGLSRHCKWEGGIDRVAKMIFVGVRVHLHVRGDRIRGTWW